VPKIKVRLEREIENAANKAIKKRWPASECRKMNGFGFSFWPDRLYLFDNAVAVFIEYKRPGERLTKGQRHGIKTLKQLGFAVAVCYAEGQAVEACRKAIERTPPWRH
jgi:hypothetical protein